jgi:hypothetical protein
MARQRRRKLNFDCPKRPTCPKLKSYWHFHGCGYSKTDQTCSRPEHYPRCPLRKHRLRNGRLNQTAYSLFLFLRDITDSDLVTWIDDLLTGSSGSAPANDAARTRESLLGPLRHVYGVADKVLSLALASVLLAAPDDRKHWHETGGNMVAVDTRGRPSNRRLIHGEQFDRNSNMRPPRLPEPKCGVARS